MFQQSNRATKINSTSKTNSTLSPYIESILSNPLNFHPARYPDKVTLKPSSYKVFSAKKNKGNNKANSNNSLDSTTGKSTDLDNKKEEQMARPRPTSMAEAVALYTGKKYLTKKEKKELEPKPLKKRKLQEQEVSHTMEQDEDQGEAHLSDDSYHGEDDNQSVSPNTEESEKLEYTGGESRDSESEEDVDFKLKEDEEDTDYHTADEGSSGSSSSSESSSEEADEEDESPSLNENVDDDLDPLSLKKALKEELQSDKSEDEDEKETPAQESKVSVSTPPTSPEDDAAKTEPQGEYFAPLYPNSEFYKIDEEYNDRGSNGSTRIYKSWREFKNRKGPLGLINHGVTCYMNAAMQSLLHIPPLLHYLVDVHHDKYSNVIDSNSVTQVLASTAAKMYQIDNTTGRKVQYINPKRIIKRLEDINCMMSEWQQEDSHEYFMSLMSRLQEDSTPKGVKLNESIIYDIFGGLLNQSVTCQNCGHVSITRQEFYDLSLGIENRKKRNSSLIYLDSAQLSQLRHQIDTNNKDTDDDDKKSLSEFLKKKILQQADIETRSRSQSPQRENSPDKQLITDNNNNDNTAGNSGNNSPTTNNNGTIDPTQTAALSNMNTPSLTPQPQQQDALQPVPQLPKYSIENSLIDFFAPELLKADKKDKSGYTCENCKKVTNAIKISTIERAPETLVVHLKRFRFNGTSSTKVKTNVSYPEMLDLTEYTTSMNSPTKYILSSVIVHQGRSVSSGHYIAHCRQPDGTWCSYDDEYINRIKARDALSDESAYFLIYQRLTHKSNKFMDIGRNGDLKTNKRKREDDDASEGNNDNTGDYDDSRSDIGQTPPRQHNLKFNNNKHHNNSSSSSAMGSPNKGKFTPKKNGKKFMRKRN